MTRLRWDLWTDTGLDIRHKRLRDEESITRRVVLDGFGSCQHGNGRDTASSKLEERLCREKSPEFRHWWPIGDGPTG